VSPGVKGKMEAVALLLGVGISLYLAWFAVRLVWVSYTLHDVAPTGDATPMWIPQLSMALGCIGFALAFLQALWARFSGQSFFAEASDEALHAD
jgi:TRAP-type C4-dicarboxylate transport system permease small subunit